MVTQKCSDCWQCMAVSAQPETTSVSVPALPPRGHGRFLMRRLREFQELEVAEECCEGLAFKHDMAVTHVGSQLK